MFATRETMTRFSSFRRFDLPSNAALKLCRKTSIWKLRQNPCDFAKNISPKQTARERDGKSNNSPTGTPKEHPRNIQKAQGRTLSFLDEVFGRKRKTASCLKQLAVCEPPKTTFPHSEGSKTEATYRWGLF